MTKFCITLFLFLSGFYLTAQNPVPDQDESSTEHDSINRKAILKQLGNGRFSTKYFDFDLRYLLKFNQYEGLRTGLGGQTNTNLSKRYRFNGYLVYGFRDHNFKYSIGGGVRLNTETETWLNLSYTTDLSETGSSVFLTDKRQFQFFEPRLLNIDLFHKHITTAVSIEHQFTNHLISETEIAVSNVNPTYDYRFVVNDRIYNEFEFSTLKMAVQWSPFSEFEKRENVVRETKSGYPEFSLQYTRGFADVFDSDFNFSKIDFRTIFKREFQKDSYAILTIVAGLANGEVPLTHLYHAYPNDINKQTILQRFSIAGINSFETMYFNEFFSDRFTTIQLRFYLASFEFSERFKPQLVLISRYALGDMDNIERHENISFGTLDKGFTESGIELNKLLFGFGLSLTYRYGAYHLPKLADNIALKFTFNITL